jgi:hypothetical protein
MAPSRHTQPDTPAMVGSLAVIQSSSKSPMSAIRKVSLFQRSNALLAAFLCMILPSCAERDLQDAERSDPSVSQVASAPSPSPALSFQLGEAISSCNIETVNGVSVDGSDVSVDASRSVIVEGWVLPPASDSAAGEAPWALHLQSPDGQLFEVSPMEWFPRPDLVDRSSEVRAARAGFRAEFSLPERADGRAGLFLAPTSGTVRPTCGLGRGIVVQRP